MHSVSDGTSKQLKLCLVLCVMFIFLLIGGRALMADADDGTNGVLRSRAFKFNHITSQQAQELLSQLKIGTGYDQLSESVLIVTSSKGADLIQATEVITLLDQPQPIGIWVLLVGSDGQPLPDVDALGATLETVTVGTLKDAPPKGTKNPVILDTLDNKLIAIAAEELLPEIQKAVETWKTQHPPALPAVPMPDVVRPAAAEQPVTKEQPAVEKTEPNEPAAGDETADEEPAPELVPLVPVQEEPSLEEVMNRLTEQEQTAVVPTPTEEAQADRTEMVPLVPDSTEDFMSDELLKALTEEEQALQPEPEPTPAVTAAQPDVQQQVQPETPKVTPDAGEEISLEDAIKMLLGDKPTEPEQPAAPEKLAPTPQEEPQRPEVISENLRLQREMAVLRQQLAEAKAQKAAPEGTIELDEPQEPEDQPAPRIITQKPRDLTQFEEAVGEEQLETVIDLPQEVELEQLVDLVGKQLGLNYMYDPAVLRNQKVFLKIHEGRIKVRDLYGLLESVLRLRGFVMIRRDNFVTILKSADAGQVAGQVDTVIRMPGDPIQPGDIIVSTLFRLDHIGADAAQKTLTGMKLGMANGFQQIPETNTLIVTDYASRMPRIEEVMQMVDVPGEEKIFKFRSLQYMQAGDLVTKLKDLVSNMEGVSMEVGDGQPAAATPTRYTTQRVRDPQTGRIETKQVPVPNQPQQVGAAAPADDKTVFIDTDDRTNRVLVIGTQDQIELINQLIDTLDVPQADLNLVKEYVIQYVEASEVVNVLNELGLANVSVSTSSQTDTGRMTAAQRAAAARTANQPTPAAATPTPSAPRSTAGDQPSISIRPATNSLLVNGTQEQHDAIELVIAHVDVVQKDQRTIREYEIQHVDTQEIIDTMSDLGIISSQSAGASTAQRDMTSRTSRTTARTAQQQQQQQQLQMGEGGAPTALAGFAGAEGSSEDITAQEPQIAVLEATNSLLVYATPRQHKAISLLIAHADRVPETTTTPYVVYALENQDPLILAEVLTKLIQETVEEVGKTTTPESRIQTAGPTGSTTATGGNGSVPSLEEQKIRIIPDEMSYSLIVYGNKRNQQWIAELIDELDEYRPQVLLDCTLVEITKNDSFLYDLDILGKTYSSATLQTGNIGAALAPFTADRFAEGRSVSGDAVAFFNSENVQALLEVVQNKGYGRVMAKPKILVNDNQEGEIKTQNTISVAQLKSNIVPTSGGTDVSAITTTDVTFNDYDAGVTLTIKPHISKGDMLRLEITLNRTDFTLKPDVTLIDGGVPRTFPSPPDRLATDVVTVATVPDGTTIILGGLEDLTQTKRNTKVPILGDLPLIGGLFRGVDNTDSQSRLYVFVKANVIRPGDEIGGLKDIRRVSARNRKTFEDLEAQFQEMPDFPGIPPAKLEPVKVLEIDDEVIGLEESN